MSSTEGPADPPDSSGSEPPAETSGPDGPIKLLLVDDHPAICAALRSAVDETMDLEVVREAGSAEEAFRILRENEVDVAIVDLSLTDSHGFDVLRTMRAEFSEVQALVFSMYDERIYAERALRAGASGYLMKAVSAEEVLRAVRRVHEGEVYLSERMTRRVLRKAVEGRSGEARFPIDELTDRELQVFQMLGQGVPLSEIAERLSLARKTVETYRRRIKKKLGIESAEEVVAHATQWTLAQPGGAEGEEGFSESGE